MTEHRPLIYGTEVPTIMTRRLTLRPHRLEDFEAYAALFASGRAAHMGQLTRRQAWYSFAAEAGSWALRGFGPWAIDLRREERFIGQISLTQPAHFPEPELGWFLLDGCEGEGYAEEAARAARAHAWDVLGLGGLVSYIAPGNARSIRLAEKLGAVLDPAADRPDAEDLVYRHMPGARA